jgi:hypothetical protein
MAYENGRKSAAELDRETQEQRERIEARIGEIKQRLSPGQLMDELLSYTKDGGNRLVSNFGAQVSANPIPAALVGVGLVWLMSSNAPAQEKPAATNWYEFDEEYPYARVSAGGLRRTSHAADDSGQWWSEFETDTGSKYRAASDSLGRRAGHFTDEAGKKFAGFIDDAGNRVRQFQDESGNALDQSLNWAKHSWRDAQRNMGAQLGNAVNAVSSVVDSARSNAAGVGGAVQSQADQLSRQITTLFDRQPLVAGALAFAAGAALGATLPSTPQEDALVGSQADAVKRKATVAAGEAYNEGKRQVAETFGQVSDKAAELYGDAKDRINKETSGRGLH